VVPIRSAAPKDILVFCVTPLAIAVALPIWRLRFKYGWAEMALGAWAWLFWIAVLAWAAIVVQAIGKFNWWWLLITAPLVVLPVFLSGELLVECAFGNCL